MAVRKSLIYLVFLFCSCAYFNTFYNAKVYFREAEKIYREQNQNTRESSAKYNKVIEKSSKIFEFYKESKYTDDALFLTAISYKRLGDYTKSKIKFEELFNFFPNSPYARMALGEYIDLLINLNYIEDATLEFKKHPEISKDASFYLIKTKLLFAQKKYADIIHFVESEKKNLTKSPVRKEVFQFALEAALKINEMEKAEEYLQQVEKYATTEDRRLYIAITRANILSGRGMLTEALQVLEKTEFQEGSQEKRVIDYEKAKLYTMAGKYEDALGVIEKIIEKTQRDSTYTKALFLKGKIMESLDSLSTAILIYQDLKNFPLSKSLRDEVEIRYNSLLEVSSEENGDQSKLRKAELYLLDLGNPEKALSLYSELFENATDNDVRAKAMYAAMIIYKNYLKNEGKAKELANRIISEFPDSYQASKITELKLLNVTEN